MSELSWDDLITGDVGSSDKGVSMPPTSQSSDIGLTWDDLGTGQLSGSVSYGEEKGKTIPLGEGGTNPLTDAAKWTSGLIENYAGHLQDLGAGLTQAILHPVKNVVNPVVEYSQEKAQAINEGENPLNVAKDVALDTTDLFLTKPVLGQRIEDIVTDPSGTLNRLGKHMYEGGAIDQALTLAPGKVNSLVGKAGKAVGQTAFDITDIAAKGKLKSFVDDVLNTREAAHGIMADTVFERAELKKEGKKFQAKLEDIYKKHKVSKAELAEIIDKAQWKGLDQLTDSEKVLWDKVVKVADDWDKLAQKYETAVPGNELEVIQRGVELAKNREENTTYMTTKKVYQDAGLFDLGQYVTKDTKQPVTFPKNKEVFTPEEYIDMAESLKKDGPIELKNTEFVIPEENLELLAQMALDNPIAREFYESYQMAREGKLHRISHSTAKVNKEGVEAPNQKVLKGKAKVFSERGYGNAEAADIAEKWLNPRGFFEEAIKGIVRGDLLKNWMAEYEATGRPIMGRTATSDDIVYIRKELMNDSNALKHLSSRTMNRRGVPEGSNPQDFIAIDKYTLKAYRDLFFPETSGWYQKNVGKVFRDLSYLFKQALIGSGMYLWGNLWGNLHQAITASNTHFLEDLSAAIKTRGELIKDFGISRNLIDVGKTPKEYLKMAKQNSRIMGDSALDKLMRGADTIANAGGVSLLRNIDATLQNSFAEFAAHSILRNKGVKFQDRNIDWIKQNMTKREFYNSLNDMERMAFIYGDLPLLPKDIINAAEMAIPFFSWTVWATHSSAWLEKNHPLAFGYLQGAVLGNAVWDQEELNAKGMGISNPQHGKIYKTDADGNMKVTESEIVPVDTSIKFITNPYEYAKKFGAVASIQNFLNYFDTRNKFNYLKRRSNYKEPFTGRNIYPDFVKKVRLDENGVVKDNAEIDEVLASMGRDTAFVKIMNDDILPMYNNLQDKPFYKPYNNQVFGGPEGDPTKPYNIPEILNRATAQYEHNALPGVDIPRTEGELQRINKNLQRRQFREQVNAAQKARQEGLSKEGR